MLVNCTNHPSGLWSKEQLCAAREAFGDIVDIPFPSIPADADESCVLEMACDYAERICALGPAGVLCGGEFCFTFALVSLLLKRGITVVAATTERCTTETVLSDGSTSKASVYKFVRFREFVSIN